MLIWACEHIYSFTLSKEAGLSEALGHLYEGHYDGACTWITWLPRSPPVADLALLKSPLAYDPCMTTRQTIVWLRTRGAVHTAGL